MRSPSHVKPGHIQNIDLAGILDWFEPNAKENAEMTDMTLRTLVFIRVKTDKIERFKSVMAELRDPTRNEAGCIRYELQQSISEPDRFVMVEEWANEAAFRNHMTTSHVLAMQEIVAETLADRLEVRRYNLVE